MDVRFRGGIVIQRGWGGGGPLGRGIDGGGENKKSDVEILSSSTEPNHT